MTQLDSALLPTDDDGTGTTGTKQNNSFWASWRTAINALIHSITNPTVTPEDIIDEVVAARGNKTDLDTRISVALDDDGLYKSVGKVLALENLTANAEGNFATIDERLDESLDDDGILISPYPEHIKSIAGAGALSGKVAVKVATGQADESNVSTTETTLHTVIIEGDTLNEDGDAIVHTMFVTTTSSASSKILRMKFGAAVLTITFAGGTAWSAEVVFVVKRVSATVQRLYARSSHIVTATSGTGAETLSGDVNLIVTGESAGGSTSMTISQRTTMVN